MTLDRFYPVFDGLNWLQRALPLGVKLVQLRIKDMQETALRGVVTKAQALARAHGAILVVNDHWRTAIDAGCDWVHLGQEDLDDADVSAIRRSGLKLGISTHDHAELQRALSFTPDYVALGPIYPTILKKMKWDRQGLDRVTEWKRLVGDIPLVAIGGMSVERAAGAFAAGADIVSAVTDITLHDDPDARMRAWLAATRRAAMPVSSPCPNPGRADAPVRTRR
ncbi:thiamine phosphate synthase [Algihabitans albus]|uniref:thiamine phosphate synthase n=1 Tax=Algihabitans albus TaxID=2164067 RepID=UPI000E5C99E0|nr:thiamine phosphate synthase [Algihabitans albus]